MKAVEPVKSFNKYYCPGCGRYFGKETEGEKTFEKETVCMRCGQKIKWGGRTDGKYGFDTK